MASNTPYQLISGLDRLGSSGTDYPIGKSSYVDQVLVLANSHIILAGLLAVSIAAAVLFRDRLLILSIGLFFLMIWMRIFLVRSGHYDDHFYFPYFPMAGLIIFRGLHQIAVGLSFPVAVAIVSCSILFLPQNALAAWQSWKHSPLSKLDGRWELFADAVAEQLKPNSIAYQRNISVTPCLPLSIQREVTWRGISDSSVSEGFLSTIRISAEVGRCTVVFSHNDYIVSDQGILALGFVSMPEDVRIPTYRLMSKNCNNEAISNDG